MEMFEADYEYEIINDVLVIYDEDLGSESVVDDIKNVISKINKEKDIENMRIICLNAHCIFEGVNMVIQSGKLVQTKPERFYAIEETDLEQALAKAETVA